MGVLGRRDGSLSRVISGHCRVGRTAASELVIDAGYVSREHAVVSWAGGAWQVKDLGSRNGTKVDGRALTVGVPQVLSPASVVTFGDDAEGWSLRDDGPPVPFATADDGRQEVAEDDVVALPDADSAEAHVYPDGEGWVLESDAAARSVLHGERVRAGGATWTLSLPFVSTPTEESGNRAMDQVALGFWADDGAVRMAVDGTEVPPRAWVRLLLLLAERRLAQAAHGDVGEPERGWMYVDELATMMGVLKNGVNVHASRARRALASLGVVNAARLVERRVSSGQLRLGTERVEIAAELAGGSGE